MKLAVSLDLPFDPVEQVALELLHAPASQARHVHVVPLRPALVEVAVALYVQQVQLIHQPVALEQRQCPIHRHAVDVGIDLGCLAQNLGGIEMLLRRLDDFQNDPALTREPYPTAQERVL